MRIIRELQRIRGNMVYIKRVGKDKRKALFNVIQKYLYEMSKYYGDEMDEDGVYEYRYLPLYFEDSDRSVYFIYDDEAWIGFALLNKYSFTGEEIDNAIAEFFIFPAYRNKGYAMDAIKLLVEERKGSWQLKYALNNANGLYFWKKVKQKYRGSEISLGDKEMVITFNSSQG